MKLIPTILVLACHRKSMMRARELVTNSFRMAKRLHEHIISLRSMIKNQEFHSRTLFLFKKIISLAIFEFSLFFFFVSLVSRYIYSMYRYRPYLCFLLDAFFSDFVVACAGPNLKKSHYSYVLVT